METESPIPALAVASPRLLNLSIPDIERLGSILAASRMVRDVASAAQAVAKITYGQELGIGPMAALRGIHFIDGNLSPSATTLAGLIQNSGRYSYRVLEATDRVCRVEFADRGVVLGPPVTFTWEQASKIRDKDNKALTEKANWRNYPEDMLFARAISRGARRYCPGILGGAPIYTAEELTDAPAPENEIVDGVYTEASDPGPATDEQKREITRAFGQLHMNGPARAAWLTTKFGKTGVSELTAAEATEAWDLLTRAEPVLAEAV